MSRTPPPLTLGIEEEYLLVDRDSLALAPVPEALMAACQEELQDQVSPEYLKCQIEVGTTVCADIKEAREELRHLRAAIARHAARFNLAPIAVSCHPFSDWRDQHHTDKERYNHLRDDMAGVMRRMMICGMHVHVGIEDAEARMDLANQLSYFLPHMLALSCSSPFWKGEDTGLSSYRLTVFDGMPRTGLPPRMTSFNEFERTIGVLVDLGIIEDASKVWWDLRPSSRFPTIEARICDASPRLETTLTLAACVQCLTRMLWRLSIDNQRWRIYDRFLIAENRWRAQRYGISAGLIDFGQREVLPFDTLVEEIIELIAEDAEALNAAEEIANLRDILERGISAERQRAAFRAAQEAGADRQATLEAVVRHLIEEYHADL